MSHPSTDHTSLGYDMLENIIGCYVLFWIFNAVILPNDHNVLCACYCSWNWFGFSNVRNVCGAFHTQESLQGLMKLLDEIVSFHQKFVCWWRMLCLYLFVVSVVSFWNELLFCWCLSLVLNVQNHFLNTYVIGCQRFRFVVYWINILWFCVLMIDLCLIK